MHGRARSEGWRAAGAQVVLRAGLLQRAEGDSPTLAHRSTRAETPQGYSGVACRRCSSAIRSPRLIADLPSMPARRASSYSSARDRSNRRGGGSASPRSRRSSSRQALVDAAEPPDLLAGDGRLQRRQHLARSGGRRAPRSARRSRSPRSASAATTAPGSRQSSLATRSISASSRATALERRPRRSAPAGATTSGGRAVVLRDPVGGEQADQLVAPALLARVPR